MQPGTLCVPPELERGASLEAFPRRAWERSSTAPVPHQQWERACSRKQSASRSHSDWTTAFASRLAPTRIFTAYALIVPTLRVGMQPGTLCVPPELERGASLEAFPRRAWERSSTAPVPHQQWERACSRKQSASRSHSDWTTAFASRLAPTRIFTAYALIVPTLRVGMQPGTLCVPQSWNAERPLRHSHAERGNDHQLHPYRINSGSEPARESNPPVEATVTDKPHSRAGSLPQESSLLTR
ncbi:hypothetical protein SRABI89_01986 [Pseudomonas koreensis]|nr:hypothetical protein SRABI89_01986 [Pseudomonas koreensis]